MPRSYSDERAAHAEREAALQDQLQREVMDAAAIDADREELKGTLARTKDRLNAAAALLNEYRAQAKHPAPPQATRVRLDAMSVQLGLHPRTAVPDAHLAARRPHIFATASSLHLAARLRYHRPGQFPTRLPLSRSRPGRDSQTTSRQIEILPIRFRLYRGRRRPSSRPWSESKEEEIASSLVGTCMS